jgi:hypothetical protein
MIKYLEAKNGAVVACTEVIGGEQYHCRNPNQVVDALVKEGGIAPEGVFCSSSMDFAKEYGFRSHYGARQRWELGLQKYQRQVEKARPVQHAEVPGYCPRCGSSQLVEAVDWQARSLDPSDPDNVCEVVEWQCHSSQCQGLSFWL